MDFLKRYYLFIVLVVVCFGSAALVFAMHPGFLASKYDIVSTAKLHMAPATATVPTAGPVGVPDTSGTDPVAVSSSAPVVPVTPLDINAYNQKILALAHAGLSTTITVLTSTPNLSFTVTKITTRTVSVPHVASSTDSSTVVSVKSVPAWPVGTVYPEDGAILPFNRIVAYYGNFYSTQMGVLGQYPVPEMMQKLQATVAEWQAADPTTPVIPALDYIAVTAQASPGADGKYRLRMPDSQINEAISLADQMHGLVFLDIQVGLSNLQTEIPLLEKYLAMPNVELSIDPEFSIKDNSRPGLEIGTYDATDINYAANYLAGLVKANNLPPKILVVHRFTQDMVTNYKEIAPLPQVQIVMDMDGWGSPAKKMNTYADWIAGQPVQFTGFKLFYKNDTLPPSSGMMTPAQVLNLTPAPSYIQYQ